MNLLAVDCCLRITGAALMTDGQVIEVFQEELGRRQTAELPVIVKSLLERNGVSFDSLDYVAVTNGPGYFTGIRVGCAYACGLAYGSGAKVIPVSPLELLAYGREGKTLAVVYAGHGYVYARCEGFLEAGEYSLEELHEWLKANPDVQVISDDPERAGVEAEKVMPDVGALCELGWSRRASAISPLELKIMYCRAPQGMENLNGRL